MTVPVGPQTISPIKKNEESLWEQIASYACFKSRACNLQGLQSSNVPWCDRQPSGFSPVLSETSGQRCIYSWFFLCFSVFSIATLKQGGSITPPQQSIYFVAREGVTALTRGMQQLLQNWLFTPTLVFIWLQKVPYLGHGCVDAFPCPCMDAWSIREEAWHGLLSVQQVVSIRGICDVLLQGL